MISSSSESAGCFEESARSVETTLDALTVGRVAENLVIVAIAVEMWMRQGAAWWRSLALGVVWRGDGGCGALDDLQTIPPEGAASLGYAPGTYEAHVASLQALEVNDATVRYLDLGEGPVVLLVHGVPTSSWVYRKVAASLAGRGFRVIAPDLPGWGASEKPEDAGSMRPEAQGGRWWRSWMPSGELMDGWRTTPEDRGALR